MMNILLISTYEMGRQPFGLASPAAWLRQAGFEVVCLDLSVDQLTMEAIQQADLVGIYVPMHMATRMAVPIIEQVQQISPEAHLVCFGLYAPVNAEYLKGLGVDTVLGGEFETDLVRLAQALMGQHHDETSLPIISLSRQTFLPPDRTSLPALGRYAHLVTNPTEEKVVGYTEASRGCKHLCRHCPIVPVYNGHFRIVQSDVVLTDIRQQVAMGAEHITFGDPDFFNGPGHALPLVEALHQEFPHLTYDVTIKVEHLLKQAKHLSILKKTGCLFITTAVEAFDEHTLTIFDKHHTMAEFESVLANCRELGLLIVPTFVAFTPWTTLEGYRDFLAEIARLGLIEQVAPIQYTLRLLIPPGSKLLELEMVRGLLGPLDQAKLSYQWQNTDPRVDQLQQDIERIVHRDNHAKLSRITIYQKIWDRVQQEVPDNVEAIPNAEWSTSQQFVPYLTEPWYC